jgi:type I restriction enzyme S subunit
MPQYSISLAGFDPGDKLKTNLFAMEKMDLLYGSIRPYLGKFGIAPFNGITTGTVHCISSVKEEDYSFVCGVVFSKAFNDFCNQVSHGTKMPIVKWDDFKSFKFAYESNVSTKFNKILIESFKLIVEKVNENIYLSKLRDELLPKLMSGEIEVPVGDYHGA